MELQARILQELELLTEAERAEVLNFILQMKGQISVEEAECLLQSQRSWVEQLADEDDTLDEWIDL